MSVFDVIKLISLFCGVLSISACELKNVSKKRDRGFNNIALVAYHQATPNMCPLPLTERAAYKKVKHIEDVEERQAEFFLRLSLCHELADDRDKAVLYAMRVVHLADVLERDFEAERIALSFLARTEVDSYLDFAWANKTLQDKDYTIYTLGTNSQKASRSTYIYNLSEFDKLNSAKFVGENK